MSGKDEPKKAKAVTATSQFQGINNYNVGLDGLASASATRDPSGGKIDSYSTLSPELLAAQQSTISGLNNNLGYIGLSPTQQLEQLNSGQNSFYNLQSELDRQQGASALAAAQARYSRAGLENSTSRGAFEGNLATQDYLRDLATRQQALEAQNGLANTNLASQSGILGQLASLQQLPLDMANTNMFTGLNNQDQVAMQNAQLQTQVNMANAQMANQMAAQAAASRGSLIGNTIGAVGSLAGLAAMGPIGGMVGSKLGQMAGGFFGGGGATSGATSFGMLPTGYSASKITPASSPFIGMRF